MDSIVTADVLSRIHRLRRENEEKRAAELYAEDANVAMVKQLPVVSKILDQVAGSNYGSTYFVVALGNPLTMPTGMFHASVIEYLEKNKYVCLNRTSVDFTLDLTAYLNTLKSASRDEYNYPIKQHAIKRVVWDENLPVGFVPVHMCNIDL